MSAVSIALKVLGSGFKAIAAAGTVAEIGEVIGKRAGFIDKDTRLIPATVDFALDILGAPKSKATEPPLPPVGEVQPEQPPRRSICPDCHLGNVIVSGAQGEEFAVMPCDRHRQETTEMVDHISGMYDAWQGALAGAGITIGDVDKCGAKPTRSQFATPFGLVDDKAFLKATNKWSDCVNKELKAQQKAAKDQAAAAANIKKAEEAGKLSQRKVSQVVLAAQAKRYQAEIDKLKQQIADEQAAEERAKMQAQIDALTTQKTDAEALLKEVSAKAESAEKQAQIDKLTAQLASRAQEGPSAMDQFFQMMMMQRMMQPPAAPAPAPQPVAQPIVIDPSGQAMMVASPAAIPWSAAPPPGEMFADDGSGMFFAGNEDDPVDPDVATILGVEGARTNGDAMLLYELRGAGWSAQDLGAGMGADIGGCLTGCALSPPVG